MKPKSYAALVAQKKALPTKAGVMLYEDTPDGRKLLVSYNEGRFAKNGHYLVLPKGGIDPGETPLHGGIRELREETGFDLANFLGKQNMVKLTEGKTLQEVTNPAYPGLTLVEFKPKPFMHEYHSRTGTLQLMAMYGIKMHGMEHLGPLKNAGGLTVKQWLDADPGIPRFPEFFAWLKAGRIPAQAPGLPVPLGDADWFAAMIKKHAPGGTIRQDGDWQETREDWQKFCVAMEADKAAYQKLRTSFEIIKTHVKKLGLLRGDDSLLKFDEKDCPLFWYVEGGQVGTAQDILVKTFRDLKANPDYARAFGGEGTSDKDLPPEQTMLRGQIAAYSSFVPPGMIRAALKEALGVTGKVAETLIDYGTITRNAAARR